MRSRLLAPTSTARIQTPLIDGKKISADLLDAPRDSVAMLRSQDIESLEDHQRQRALQDVRFLFHCTAVLVSNRKSGTLPLGKQTGKISFELNERWAELMGRDAQDRTRTINRLLEQGVPNGSSAGLQSVKRTSV